LKINSIKAEFYGKSRFEEASNFIKLCNEYPDLFKCQMKSGAYSDTPFFVVTAALLQSIIPIAIGFCSIGSNRIVLLLPRASMLKKQ